MQIEIGSTVYSTDHGNVGTVDRLILDPGTNQVKAAVIRKGMILPRDIEVPITSFSRSTTGDLSIDLSVDEIKSLPEFEEAIYVMPPPEYQLPDGYTAGSLYWPAGLMMGPPQNVPGRTAVPEPTRDGTSQDAASADATPFEFDSAMIGRGSTVTGPDGESIGKVEELAFDPQTGKLSGLVVRSGLVVHTDRHIDASYIDSIYEGVIMLKVSAGQLPT